MSGIHVVGKFGWEDRGVGKFSVEKSDMKLNEVEKFYFHLKRINEVGKLLLKLERSIV